MATTTDPRDHFCENCRPVWDSAKAVLGEYMVGLRKTLWRDFAQKHLSMMQAGAAVVERRRNRIEAELQACQPWEEDERRRLGAELAEVQELHEYNQAMQAELALQGHDET